MSASNNTQDSKSLHHEQHFDISSLHIVKSEIDASINQVEAALNLYMSDQSNTVGLFDSADSINQVSGILRLMQMDGAIELCDAIHQILVQICKDLEAADDHQITALSEGLMTLSRYLEFVLLRETLSPQLLLPIINKINRLLNKPIISEGQFLLHHINDGVIQRNLSVLVQPTAITTRTSDKDRAHLTRLFQIGLSNMLQKKAKAHDFTYMQTAVSHIADREPQSAEGLYWQIAKQVVATFDQNTYLSEGRKRILSQMERRIARKTDSISRLSQTSAIADVLTLTAISPQSSNSTLIALGLSETIKPDQDVLDHKHFLFGPDQAVVHEVSQLITENIIKIKEQVDLIVNNEQQDDALTKLSFELKELGQTLEVLTLSQAGKGLVEQSNQVAIWPKMPDENQINTLMDRLLDSENAIILMEQTHTPGVVMAPFTNLRVSLHQLIEARNLLVAESRTDLSTVTQALLAYLENNHDVQKLEGMSDLCESVAGAMSFLNAPRGHAILQNAANYIKEKITPEHQPDADTIAHLMDAIVSVDYVLEGIATKKPAGEQPYGFGEVGLAKLGYPVKTAA
ncbi:MAG: hypothetical protein NVS3B3_00640 [Aquirhabdus sp.]